MRMKNREYTTHIEASKSNLMLVERDEGDQLANGPMHLEWNEVGNCWDERSKKISKKSKEKKTRTENTNQSNTSWKSF